MLVSASFNRVSVTIRASASFLPWKKGKGLFHLLDELKKRVKRPVGKEGRSGIPPRMVGRHAGSE